MIVVVPVKRVPDPYERIQVSGGAVCLDDVKWVINPFDEIALEEAVRLREGGAALEIVAVSIGVPECEATLRAALAMGADRAILVEHDGPLEPRQVACLLQHVAEGEGARLVLMGKQAIDDDYGTTGQMLAAKLQWPIASFASEIVLEGESAARVVREVDAGRETVRVALPAVITADLRLNEPRYVALPAILKARSKPLVRTAPEELSGPSGWPSMPEIELVELVAPPARKPGRRVASVDALVAALKDEAKVL
ncbi:electron transfer flavoprotein subunit beta/FixA family protein [Armatimonas rosea]|uniref:Electron transfer flavoprotein subunit beta n=1 Tax=Armatimonas rosea TaxID=685828 RepID=A0A7W9SVE9_ARMRO|nr:electron transfer flavoprotein subunit beta/FixA family protein [Armatimonas rosea]MBB6053576.1 electron transfer flavoprotein beta subunit [Armatimonas rosea]